MFRLPVAAYVLTLIGIIGTSCCWAQNQVDGPDRGATDTQAIDRAIVQARALRDMAARHSGRPMADILRPGNSTGQVNPDAFANLMTKHQLISTPEMPIVIAFVSTSMSKETLRAIGKDISAVGGVMVLRGIRGQLGSKNALQETIRYLESVGRTGASMQINPTLFRRFNIDRVPAYVISSNAASCESASPEQCGGVSPVVFGDVSLQFALEEISKQGGSYAGIAATYLKRLEKD